jgi:hypothetical protein
METTSTPNTRTLCAFRQSAEESGDDRPTGFQKVDGMPNSPGRGGPRRSGSKVTLAYQSWALPEVL